jgi:hypothetical protein
LKYGRSDESLNSSGDITSTTIQNYHHSFPTQTHHGDESDEGLVKLFLYLLKIISNKIDLISRIVCHQLIHVYHMIVMMPIVSKHLFFLLLFLLLR